MNRKLRWTTALATVFLFSTACQLGPEPTPSPQAPDQPTPITAAARLTVTPPTVAESPSIQSPSPVPPSPTGTPIATATPFPTPFTVSPTPFPLPTPTSPTPPPTVTPLPSPTPGPLSAAQIYRQISPSVVQVWTTARRGSGTLIEGGYILTSGHVVSPYTEARVVFHDGAEHGSAPVVAWDPVLDLALLGPLNTAVAPAAISGDESAVEIGSEVYLLGHVSGEAEPPEPTVARGLVTRIRQWPAHNMTYFQTDIPVESGQSGGVLVSERGAVMGVVGQVITRNDYALAASSVDVFQHVTRLISDDGASERVSEMLPASGGALEHDFVLDRSASDVAFVLNAPLGTEFEFAMESDSHANLRVSDPNGRYVAGANAWDGGSGNLRDTIRVAGPHIVTVSSSRLLKN